MTDLNSIMGNAVASQVASTSSSSASSTLSTTIQEQLAALGIDTSNITSAAQAKVAIAKAEAKKAEDASLTDTSDKNEIKDTVEISTAAKEALSKANLLSLENGNDNE